MITTPCIYNPDCLGHELGDEDCQGYPIGYIDPEGLGWQSLKERDVALASSEYEEAYCNWARCGGIIPEPDAYAIANRVCLDPDNIEEAVQDALDSVRVDNPIMMMRSRLIEQIARWN